MKNQRDNRGVTLMEVMVTVSIIILISSIATTVFSSTRIKARNAARITDVQTVQRALEVYYQENNHYPSTNGQWRGQCANSSGNDSCPAHAWGVTADDWVPGLPKDLIAQLPQDPYPDNCVRCYLYMSNGVDYKIVVHVPENASDSNFAGFIDPARDGGSSPCIIESSGTPWAWALYSPGGRCW